MKQLLILFVSMSVMSLQGIQAQSVDEILENYFENTGGRAQWEALQGVKYKAKVNQMGMEIPIEVVELKSGKRMTVINFQGQTIKQDVFDGTVVWNLNMMTQKAEKSDQETTDNSIREMGSFPDPFLNYKSLGYSVELMGIEEIDGAECFKIKLIQKPLLVDGEEVENSSYYYFDTENFVPLVVQSEIKTGEMKGQMSEIKMSDYQEVEGLYFPFSQTQGLKGQEGQVISFEEIVLNPEIADSEFAFPEDSTNE